MSETILIITPTPVEFEAMSRRLQRREEQNDDVVIARGSIGKANVVVAMTGMGEESTSAAVTKLLLSTEARYVLLVGVAGGFGRAKLGDVVVPTSVQSLDFGKIEDSHFHRRKEYDWVPDLRLVQVATRLAEEESGRWKQAIRLPRPDGRTIEATNAHVGYAGSSNKVIDDPEYLQVQDAMTTATEIMAVEMEAIGAAAAVRLQQSTRAVGLLMIRGISDIPAQSGEKTDVGSATRVQWKPYAADAAAAFTTVLLQTLQPNAGREQEEPMPRAEVRTQGSRNRRTAVVTAIFLVAAAIVAGLMMASRGHTLPETARLTGRVVNARDHKAVSNAKVSLELAGSTPLLRYPDGEGVFDFGLPEGAKGVRIRVEAQGFDYYDRWVSLQTSSGIEEIRLEPTKKSTPPPLTKTDGGSRRVAPPPTPSPKSASIIDETLRPISGEDGPWAVVIFGRQDRRTDVQSWVRSALAGSGHDTVSLFLKVSDEQRVAPDLYRGSSGLFTDMKAGRFVSRMLVAKLTVHEFPAVEGLIVAEAKLAIHILSPSGDMLKEFDLSEKGSGLDSESAQGNAIEELQSVINRDLPSSI